VILDIRTEARSKKRMRGPQGKASLQTFDSVGLNIRNAEGQAPAEIAQSVQETWTSRTPVRERGYKISDYQRN